eukprot:6437145-Pyramimonas_sp.AAC.1
MATGTPGWTCGSCNERVQHWQWYCACGGAFADRRKKSQSQSRRPRSASKSSKATSSRQPWVQIEAKARPDSRRPPPDQSRHRPQERGRHQRGEDKETSETRKAVERYLTRLVPATQQFAQAHPNWG